MTGGYYSEEAMKDRLARESGSVYDPNLVSRFLEFLQTRELH